MSESKAVRFEVRRIGTGEVVSSFDTSKRGVSLDMLERGLLGNVDTERFYVWRSDEDDDDGKA